MNAKMQAIAAAAWCLASCAPAARQEPPRPSAMDGPSHDRVVYVGTYTGPGVAPDGHAPSTASASVVAAILLAAVEIVSLR